MCVRVTRDWCARLGCTLGLRPLEQKTKKQSGLHLQAAKFMKRRQTVRMNYSLDLFIMTDADTDAQRKRK